MTVVRPVCVACWYNAHTMCTGCDCTHEVLEVGKVTMLCDDWIDIGTVCRLEAGHEGMHEDDFLRWERKLEDHEVGGHP